MTQNEALEKLREYDNCAGLMMHIDHDTCVMAIDALEEMAKIKEMGDCYIIPKNGVWEVNGIDIHEAIEKQIPKNQLANIKIGKA